MCATNLIFISVDNKVVCERQLGCLRRFTRDSFCSVTKNVQFVKKTFKSGAKNYCFCFDVFSSKTCVDKDQLPPPRTKLLIKWIENFLLFASDQRLIFSSIVVYERAR